jgi:hypothetical protein
MVWASNSTLYTSNSAEGRSYKQTQSRMPSREEACRREQTKPIGRSESCETNPIWGDPSGVRRAILWSKANPSHYADPEIGVPGRANYAKQSHTWAGWGIWVDARGAYCAKRSQSGAAHLASGGELRQTDLIRPSRWAGRSPGGRNAPNEANLVGPNRAKQTQSGGGQSRQTNPIWLVGQGPGGRNMPNEANLGQPACHPEANYAKRTQSGQAGGRAGALEDELRRTKPISGQPPIIA